MYFKNIDKYESKQRNLNQEHLHLKEIFNCLLTKLKSLNHKIYQIESGIKKEIKKNENLKQYIGETKLSYNVMKEDYENLPEDDEVMNELKTNSTKQNESNKKSASASRGNSTQKSLKTNINLSYTKSSGE